MFVTDVWKKTIKKDSLAGKQFLSNKKIECIVCKFDLQKDQMKNNTG